MESVPHTPFMIVIRSARRKLLWGFSGGGGGGDGERLTGRGKSGRGRRCTGGAPFSSPPPSRRACAVAVPSGGEGGRGSAGE